MDDRTIPQIRLKEALQLCRSILEEINDTTIASVLREQSIRFDKVLERLEIILPRVETVLEQDAKEVGIRAATIFIIGLWSKLKDGKTVSNLTKDDWKNIMNIAYEKAAEIDPEDYSLLVFDLYRRSIAFAIKPMSLNASTSTIDRLKEIVATMEEQSENLSNGEMTETKYIEENLWLSLEAVFLVLTDRMSFNHLPEERKELAEAVSALIFQKIRYSHYDRELAFLDGCLDYQKKLDEKLTQEINEYVDALRDELDEFDSLVEKAFDTSDFQIAFRGSVVLADFLGAEEILRNNQDIDEYFLE